jgi:bifunctional UDP-N-acetylglucosamine pyrophosphorylase/glucosamine-1-phosphate N-acetyltransferase
MLTKDRPKSMLPVLGKPIMARVMDRLRDAGIRRFVVVIGDQEGAIAAYLTSSWYPDAEIKFVIQAVPTGTVDALLLAAPNLDGPFVLTAVDNLTSPDHVRDLMKCFDMAGDPMATLSLLPATPEQIRVSSGVVIENDLVTAIEEKPPAPQGKHAAIMLYAFSQTILDYLPKVKVSARGEREIASAIQLGIEDGQEVGYVITDWRLHLTHEVDLLAINRQFLKEGRDAHILSEIPGSVHIIPPVRIDPKVSVGQAAQIGPNVYLESGATVGPGATLKNALVLSGATVAAAEHCQDEIIDRRVRISATSQS